MVVQVQQRPRTLALPPCRATSAGRRLTEAGERRSRSVERKAAASSSSSSSSPPPPPPPSSSSSASSLSSLTLRCGCWRLVRRDEEACGPGLRCGPGLVLLRRRRRQRAGCLPAAMRSLGCLGCEPAARSSVGSACSFCGSSDPMVGGELLRPGAEAEAAAAENGGRGGDHGDRAQDGGGGGRPGNRAQDGGGGGGLWPEELGRRLGPAKGQQQQQQQRRRQPAVLLLDCRHLLEYTKSQLQGAVNPGWAAGGGGGGPGPSGRAKITVFDLLAGRRTAARHPAPAPVTVPVPPPLSLHLLLDSLSPAGKDAPPPPPGDDGETDGSETSRPQGVPDGTSGGPGGDPHAANPSTPDIENAEISPILPFLYLGNERDAQDLARLRRLNVGYVINVTTHLPLYHAQAGAMHYKRLPATDNSKQNLRQYFEEAFEFIEEAHQSGKGVLVHCQAGVSRSATLVIAYLMKHTLMTMTDAYKYVKGKRLIISPNLNFMGQLLEFEMDLNKGLTPRILIPRLTGLETEV